MKTLFSALGLTAGLALAATPARAQASISFGPRLGGNLATATFNSLESLSASGFTLDYHKSPIVAPQVGMVVNMQWGNWAFQPALLFSQKGVKQTVTVEFSGSGYSMHEDISIVSRINYLELPLNVVYTSGGDHGFQLFAGPYLAVGVGGKATYTDHNTTTFNGVSENYSENGAVGYTFANKFDDPNSPNSNSNSIFATARRFDAGIAGGVGYRLGPVQAQLGYSLGLVNAQPDYPDSYQMPNETGYHRSLQLTATYFLAHK
ncbi:PorT family protein [Hymenobacter sp. DH14]|uniref:PorT family protein n=1 Tax=Hymenobacter cyanobacteriorum TaxID=2926463 RepID=A0A9X1VK04_9BACT|nr:porin family protein [Hymenobacter cyanobacteriorum]MCI1187796.1 PorT family protein [Hymenobacter cyanobacteriorum]